MTKAKLWTLDFLVLSLINFILLLIFYLLVVIIGLYAVEQFQASLSEAGLVSGIFIVGTLVGRLFIGPLIDTAGRRKTLLLGLVLCLGTVLLYYLKQGTAVLILSRFLHGIGLGVASTATGAIVAHMIPMSRKAEGISYFSLSTTLAAAIGPFIGLYMVQYVGFDLIFTLCAVLVLVALGAAFFLKVPEAVAEPVVRHQSDQAVPVSNGGEKLSNGEEKRSGPVVLVLSRFLEPRALPISIVTFLIAFCYSGVLSYINAYAIERDLVEAASFFFILYSIAVMCSRPFTGRMLDARGANIVMYPGFLILAGGLVLLGIADNGVKLLLAGALIGLGFGNMQSSTQALAVKLADPRKMGLATSTFFIFLDAGLGFGPYLQGFIIPQTGYANLYLILGGVALASAGVYYWLHGRLEKRLRVSSL